jgi:hypothetical protein
MKKQTAILISAGAALAATAALAGYVQPAPVDVDLTTNTALGDQVTARYSKNDIELIGCGIRKTMVAPGTYFHFGFCQATDRGGDAITCFTEDEGLLDTISSSADYGFVTFSWNPGATPEDPAECTRIGFSNQSFYLPKKLESNE